jgi:hypothetical protein
VVAASEADALSGAGSAQVWTSKENPELGRYFLPRTDGVEPVHATTTDLLTPNTEYFARLLAVDTGGQTSASGVAAARTTDPPVGALVVFADADTMGSSQPSTFALSTSQPYRGGACYLYTSDCPSGESICWENLRRQGLGIDLTPVTSGDYVATAYLELAVAT